MIDRPLRPLSALTSFIGRGVTPSYVQDGGVLVLNQKCVRDQRINLAVARRTAVSAKGLPSEKLLRRWDILVNSTGVGTLGRVGQVVDLDEVATVDSHITIVRPDATQVHPRYLGYLLRLHEAEIERLGEGSTGQTELARQRLATFVVNIPSKSEQQAVAAVLGALDDKVELNRRINTTIEAALRDLLPKLMSGELSVRVPADSGVEVA